MITHRAQAINITMNHSRPHIPKAVKRWIKRVAKTNVPLLGLPYTQCFEGELLFFRNLPRNSG